MAESIWTMAEVVMSCYDSMMRKKRLIETGAKVEAIVRNLTKQLKIMPVKTRQGSAR